MAKSSVHADLLKRHKAVLPAWIALYYEHPIALVDGDGRRVIDAEGNQYLDFFGGILTTMTGYKTPQVVEAIQEQAAKMLHTSTLYLIRRPDRPGRAPRQAVGDPRRQGVLRHQRHRGQRHRPDAGHRLPPVEPGAGDAQLLSRPLVLGDGDHRQPGLVGDLPIAGFRSPTCTAATSYRSPFGHLADAEFTEACVDDLEDLLAIATSGDVACMIAEPIQGVGGFAVLPTASSAR